MKKITLLTLLVVFSLTSYAQEEGPKEGWTKKGNFSFLFNQSAFSNWVAGGENTVAGNLGINYDFNYLKGDFNWDNKIVTSYIVPKS